MYIDQVTKLHSDQDLVRENLKKHPLSIFVRRGEPVIAALSPDAFNRLNEEFFHLRYEQLDIESISIMNTRFHILMNKIDEGDVVCINDRRSGSDISYFMPYKMFDEQVGVREYYEICDDIERRYEVRRVDDYVE